MKALLTLSALLLLICFNANAANSLNVTDAWIAEAPPGASVMAGYMKIENPSSTDIDIVSVSSPSFKQIEMHQSKESDGFAKMLPQKKLTIPAHGNLILTSGSYHLMLIKPEKWFKQGDSINVSFNLSNHQTITLDLNVKKATFAVKRPAMKCAAGKCGGK